jgi:hypothetical protein
MTLRSGLTFPRLYVALALLQIAHSTEEFLTRFYERIMDGSTLLHGVLPFVPVFQFTERFFVTLNLFLIATILAAIPLINHGHLAARLVAAVLSIIEILNGTAHLSITAMMGAYFPGALTAPFLLIVGLLLLVQAWKSPPRLEPGVVG